MNNHEEIVFNMSDIKNILNDIEISVDEVKILCYKKVAEKIKKWMKKNSNHDFPKTKQGWCNLLFNQFEFIKVKVDPLILMNKENKDIKDTNFLMLKQRIDKFLKKSKNKIFHQNNYEESMKKISNFCRFKYRLNTETIYQELIENDIIDMKTKKRKRFILEDKLSILDSNDNDTVYIGSNFNIKKRKTDLNQ